jgi:hypothetical protein
MRASRMSNFHLSVLPWCHRLNSLCLNTMIIVDHSDWREKSLNSISFSEPPKDIIFLAGVVRLFRPRLVIVRPRPYYFYISCWICGNGSHASPECMKFGSPSSRRSRKWQNSSPSQDHRHVLKIPHDDPIRSSQCSFRSGFDPFGRHGCSYTTCLNFSASNPAEVVVPSCSQPSGSVDPKVNRLTRKR